MRRIPRTLAGIRRPYRLAPELDVLSNAQCELIMEHFRPSLRDPRVRALDHGAAAVFAFLVSSFLLLFLPSRGPVLTGDGELTPLGWFTAVIALLAGALVWLKSIQFAIAQQLGQIANSVIRREHCRRCNILLARLTPDDQGLVACPHCRHPYVDPAHLRSADQLIACTAWTQPKGPLERPQPAGDRACDCGYPLRGLPVADETAMCPECGTHHAMAAEDDPPDGAPTRPRTTNDVPA